MLSVLAVLSAGCSNNVPGTAVPDPAQQGWTVRQALATLPASTLDTTRGDLPVIVLGDLVRATELAGVDRPGPGASIADIARWTMLITGYSEDGSILVASMLPDVVVPQNLGRTDEIRDELGWDITDVDSFAEVQAPPFHFAALEGSFDEASINAAQGDPTDGIWRIGPTEDYEQDLAGATAARRLGQSMRTGLRNGMLGVSIETPVVQEWLGTPAGLDTVPSYADLATALDAHDVYSALLVTDTSGLVGTVDAGPDQPGVLDAFDSVAIGLTVVDDAAVMVVAYHFPDAATATANVDTLRTLVEEGSSVRSGRPWSEMLDVDDISADGSVLTGTFTVTDASPTLGWSMVYVRDTLLLHR